MPFFLSVLFVDCSAKMLKKQFVLLERDTRLCPKIKPAILPMLSDRE